MTERLLEQDLQKILDLLQESPRTPSELAIATHLRVARVTHLLERLQEQHLVHAPRCVESARGHTVPVWELLPIQESLDLLPPSSTLSLEQQETGNATGKP